MPCIVPEWRGSLNAAAGRVCRRPRKKNSQGPVPGRFDNQPMPTVAVIEDDRPTSDQLAGWIKAARPELTVHQWFDRDSAEAALAAGQADLIAFARAFLANPDLVKRMQSGAALNAPDMTTFYTPGPKGYTDYPVLAG